MIIFILIAIISLILFVNNLVEIIKKVKNDQSTTKNTLICSITLTYSWLTLLFLCAG